MTDARIPERWLLDRRLNRLSDAHYRSFVQALVWSVSNRTDGVIESEDLALIPNFANGAPKEFVRVGLWTPRQQAGGWHITEYEATQTTSAQLDTYALGRVKAREKKARQRAAKRAADDAVPQDVSGGVSGGVSGDRPPYQAGQARPGKDRPGQERSRLSEQLTELDEPVGGDGDGEAAAQWPAWRGSGLDPFQEYR